MATKTVCDICGKEIDTKNEKLYFKLTSKNIGEKDICSTLCLEQLAHNLYRKYEAEIGV